MAFEEGLSIGGGWGNGLLCRLLRDLGYDAWIHDLHTTNIYVPGYQTESLVGFPLITAFEVFEHLENPAAEAGQLLAADPDFLIVGTARYQGQGQDWRYLFPFHGQHVFFWSQKAHAWLAKQHGYEVICCGHTISVYAKPTITTQTQRLLIRICEYGAKATQSIIPFLRRPGVARDQAEIIEHVIRQAGSIGRN